MADVDPQALQALQAVLRQLREIKGVREVRPGVFQVRGAPFVQLRQGDGGGLLAELRKPGGSGFDRYPLDTAPRQRKLVEDARLRAAKLDDE
jgi:hypothetical protein